MRTPPSRGVDEHVEARGRLTGLLRRDPVRDEHSQGAEDRGGDGRQLAPRCLWNGPQVATVKPPLSPAPAPEWRTTRRRPSGYPGSRNSESGQRNVFANRKRRLPYITNGEHERVTPPRRMRAARAMSQGPAARRPGSRPVRFHPSAAVRWRAPGPEGPGRTMRKPSRVRG